MVVDASGTVHIVWLRRETDQSYEVYYTSRSPGGAWSQQQMISLPQASSAGPHIAIDGSGRIHAIWF
jgi:hypothetical protein